MTDPIEVARQHDEAFNAQDVKTRMAVEASDIETVMPGGMTMRGPEQTIEVVKAFWEAIPDGKIVRENEIVAGDTVIAEGTMSGTHKGVFRTPAGEVPPTGNQVTLRYAAVKQIKDGKLVSEHLYWDQLEFLQQIGALPPAGS